MYEKVCVICFAQFTTRYKRQKACVGECATQLLCSIKKAWTVKNKDRIREHNLKTKLKRRVSGKEKEYRNLRRKSKAGYLDRFMERAKVETKDTNLSREYLDSLFGEECAVSGVKFKMNFTLGTSFTNPYAPSIDRIDSTKGYYIGNVQIVLSAINFAKNSMSMDDFTDVWKTIMSSWKALEEHV